MMSVSTVETDLLALVKTIRDSEKAEKNKLGPEQVEAQQVAIIEAGVKLLSGVIASLHRSADALERLALANEAAAGILHETHKGRGGGGGDKQPEAPTDTRGRKVG